MGYEVFYSSTVVQVVTVNCARIIHGNQVATNGVVHVIDRVISTVGNTIRDMLDIEDDLSSLNVSDSLFITISRNIYVHSEKGSLEEPSLVLFRMLDGDFYF